MFRCEQTYDVGFGLGLKPDPYINLVEWSNEYRRLPKESSVEPGVYRTSRTPYVEEIMMELSPQSKTQQVVVLKGTQLGFALDVNTPIPTPTGFVNMVDVCVGDTVFDENGRPCRVNYVSPIYQNHECRKVYFSDGSEIICDKDHLWTVTDTRKYDRLKTKTISTQEIMDTAHKTYTAKKYKRNRYAIPVAGAIETEERNFLISPYTLGCWLGDGSNASATITQSREDIEEVASHILESGHPVDVRYSEKDKGNTATILVEPKRLDICSRGHVYAETGRFSHGGCKKCGRQRQRQRINGIPMDTVVEQKTFYSRLVDLNLIKNKHIPPEYLRGSYQQRLELVQGLMDTDGSITKDGYQEFTQIDKGLALQFRELLSSLGIKSVLRERAPQKNVKMPHGGYSDVKKQHRISFYSQTDKPVFKLKRKLERMRTPEQVKRPMEVKRRRILDVYPIPSVPVRCISVSSESSLYLCGETMIPTHNTEIGNNFLFYIAHLFPGPSMMAMPTDDMAKKNSKKKIAPSINAMPCLKGIIKKAKSRDSGNTLLLKEFPGGSWTFTGSNSPASARSDSIRYLILDDLDGFSQDAGDEGAPHDLLKKRTDAFGSKRKIYINSTPTVKGASHIEGEWIDSSQGQFSVPCPHCATYQALEFGGKDSPGGIRFRRDADGQVKDVWYQCCECNQRIEEWHKTEMMKRGEYIHKYPDREKRGFRVNSLYSPVGWLSWKQIVTEFLKAAILLKKGSTSAMKVWTNTRTADVFEDDGEQPEWTKLSSRAEPYKILTVPRGGLLLCAGVDTQDNRLEVLIKAYGREEENWVIYQTAIFGDPDLPDVWRQLDDLLTRSYEHQSGAQLHIMSTGIDTGGHKTQAVYNYVRARSPRVFAVKGASSIGKPILNRPSSQDVDFNGLKISNGVELWSVGTDTAKGTIYNRLKLTAPGPGYYHFPIGLDDEFYRQLTAEKIVKKFVKGYPRYEWVKMRERNDVLDCDVYCLAAAYKAGVNRINFDKVEKTLMNSNMPPVGAHAQPVKPIRNKRNRNQPRPGGYQRPSWMD